jgi:diacylglycerol O-acyltransferase
LIGKEWCVVAARLSSLDLSFLCLEGIDTPMHLGAVLIFRPAIGPGQADTAERLASVLRSRAAAVPRLRRRLGSVHIPPGGAAWVDDPDFDPARHVRRSSLPAPGGPTELAARTGELLAVALHRRRPLWELHVLDGLADDTVAVLAKIHHALADGLRALLLGMALFDDPHQPAAPERSAATVAPAADGLAGAVSALLAPARPLLDPRTAIGQLTRQARQAGRAAGITASVLATLRHPAPRSPLNGRLGPDRRLAMLRVDLDDVHRVRKAHGGTVNDVLLTLVAGALRDWLTGRGPAPTRPLRGLVPVSYPHPDPADTAGNRLSGYLADLPVHEPDPLQRLRAVRHAMTMNKAAGPGRGPGAFPVLAGLLPPLLHRLATPMLALTAPRLFNTVITQVPVPDLPLTLAGTRLTALYPVVPLAAGQALGVAMATYHGTLHVGLHADPAALPDLDTLAQHFGTALDALLAC